MSQLRPFETISELAPTVTPAKAGVQSSSKILDTGFLYDAGMTLKGFGAVLS